jgi:thymidylate synthase
MGLFFRSWDLFTGLPENLGGLQLLKEYVLAQLEFQVQDGPIVAFSDGLHLYEMYFNLVNVLNVDKI